MRAYQLMPRDIKTRWNSTYDMLNFAVEHRDAINVMTSDRSEWTMIEQLRDILQACGAYYYYSTITRF